jgi:hypothetical protein
VITPGTLVNTDEYIIYNKLRDWGYEFVTQWGNMQEMKTVTAFVRFMSTPLRAFGHSYAPGFGHIEAYRRKNCRAIWAFSSLFTTFAGEEKPCCRPWPASFSRLLVSTPKRRMSQMIL